MAKEIAQCYLVDFLNRFYSDFSDVAYGVRGFFFISTFDEKLNIVFAKQDSENEFPTKYIPRQFIEETISSYDPYKEMIFIVAPDFPLSSISFVWGVEFHE